MITPMILERIEHFCSLKQITDPSKEVPGLLDTVRTLAGDGQKRIDTELKVHHNVVRINKEKRKHERVIYEKAVVDEEEAQLTREVEEEKRIVQ